MVWNWKRAWLCLMWVWIQLGPLAPAAAQYAPRQGFRLERWASPPTARDGFAVTRPGVLPHGVWSAQIISSYAYRPLVLRNPREHAVVAHRLSAELTGAVGLFDRLQVYGRLPFTVLSVGEDVLYRQTYFAAPTGAALSDMAFGATGSLFSAHGLSFGARAELMLPTGNRSQLAGDSAIAPRAHALAEYAHRDFSVAVTGGGAYRPTRSYALSRIGSELEWGLLLRFLPLAHTEVLLEAFGTRALHGRSLPSASDTLDLLLGARRSADTGVVRLRAGASIGAGVSRSAGEPTLRAMLQVGVEPRPKRPAATRKVTDSDQDGVDDEHDECPSSQEDHDGFEDEDGCPDEDNDGDGILDRDDHCPELSGTSIHGCPLPDADGDTIPDERDRCPDDPENFNGIRDEDGCPERDLDGDGLDDDRDRCIDVKGPPEHDGCPAHARFAGEILALLTPITFVDAALAPESGPVLDDIAVSLTARPLLTAQIAVWAPLEREARARAEAIVTALVERGVEGARLRASAETGPARLVIRLRAPAVDAADSPPSP